MSQRVVGMERVSSEVVGRQISLAEEMISLVQKRNVSSLQRGMISLVVGDH